MREPPATIPSAPARPSGGVLIVAAACWVLAGVLIAQGVGMTGNPFGPARWLVWGALALAGLATFGPLERWLELPGLTAAGVWSLLLFGTVLAYVPPPTHDIRSLPDIPPYLLLMLGLGALVRACTLPVLYGLGQRFFTQRAWRYDARRARRQAVLCGIFSAVLVLLAGLRAISILSVVLTVLILCVAELLFLARIRATS